MLIEGYSKYLNFACEILATIFSINLETKFNPDTGLKLPNSFCLVKVFLIVV